ncbi:MAG: glycosyltransferase [Gammaproteobacteria bacterium]|nr:glycosyltransferase [Gammaproteobacteria bacterium]
MMNANPKDTPRPRRGARPEPPLHSWRHWLFRQRLLLEYRYSELSSLSHRGINSLKLRGLVPTLRIVAKRLFPPRRQPYPLLLYRDAVQAADVRFFRAASPRASIVVPVHGQLALTLRCLKSLALSSDAASFEVIVMDDASPDESGDVLPGIEGLRYRRNPENLGFIGTCNAGAALARGEFVVFLNNDTLVQPGWLDALAAIMVPTSLFTELGGFDPHYAPAYYEDTDLAMRVRERGLRVRFQPASVVVHLEGASSGTDTRTGIKAYQLVNEGKFRDRWAARLPAQPADPEPSDTGDQAAVLASIHRCGRRVLVIDSYTPTPDRDSGSLRMLEMLALLVEEGCSVVFFCQNITHDGKYTEALQQLGVEVWWQPWVGYLPTWLGVHGGRFDAVIVSRHYVLKPLLPMLRELAPQAQVVFDTVDLHFLREQREAAQSDNPAARVTAARTLANELGLIRKSDLTWVVSAVERDLLATIAPECQVGIVSNIHRCTEHTPGFDSRRDLVFVGSFRHPPNVDAALWLAREIFPLIHSRLPEVRLHLVGADAPETITGLASIPGVEVRGHVPDLDPLLDQTRISLAPLRYGAGIKGKINQALSRGLPVVATRCAAEGMFLVDGQDVLEADAAADFADAVVRLYGDEALWNTLREGGLANTRTYFSRETARRALKEWIANLPPRMDGAAD